MLTFPEGLGWVEAANNHVELQNFWKSKCTAKTVLEQRVHVFYKRHIAFAQVSIMYNLCVFLILIIVFP